MMKKLVSVLVPILAFGCAPQSGNVDKQSRTTTYDANSIVMPSAALDFSAPLTRIGFGSCLKEKDSMSIWDDIGAQDPDLFVFLGDNVYGDLYTDDPRFDNPDMPYMRASYRKLKDSQTFANFRQNTPMMFTWDDHDFGVNDGGADYPFKEKAESLFFEAWDIPANDIRRTRPGIYTSEMIGPQDEKVQIILLDTRYFRGPLEETDEKNAPLKERYVPSNNAASTILGNTQWDWLRSELEKPADLRVLVSSIQVIADGHGWEAWRTLPLEREKLYGLLKETNADNTIIVSGDRHSGAFYERSDVTGSRLLEMTTSSLNAPVSLWRARSGETRIEPGPYRDGDPQFEVNYGLMDIDWKNRKATLQLISPGNDTKSKIFDF